MKVWQKLIIVVVSMGAVGGFSFLAGVHPEMSMMLSSVNVGIVAVCSFFTGYPTKVS
jgi:hypothetical protein